MVGLFKIGDTTINLHHVTSFDLEKHEINSDLTQAGVFRWYLYIQMTNKNTHYLTKARDIRDFLQAINRETTSGGDRYNESWNDLNPSIIFEANQKENP